MDGATGKNKSTMRSHPAAIMIYLVSDDSCRLINRKVPINWSILRERIGTCPKCSHVAEFKNWNQAACYPLEVVICPKCFYELEMFGAVKDYFREKK